MEQQFHLKRLIVLMSSVLLVIAQMGAFTYIWFHSYVYLGALDKPFYFMGNFAVIGLYTVMLLLGKDRSLQRMQSVIDSL